MFQRNARHIFTKLQLDNYKAFYLAFTRVMLSFLILKELALNWNSIDLLFSEHALSSPIDHGVNKILLLPVDIFHQHHVLFLLLFSLLLVLNIVGYGKWLTALLIFICYDFLLKQNFYLYSGGERMARLMLLYMVFANSYEYFSIKPYYLKKYESRKLSNLLSNLAAISIMLQLCLAYLASALSKLDSPLWREGIATYYIFRQDSYLGTRWNYWISQQQWLVFISTYLTLLFELLFPFFIWLKKIRKPLLITGLLFHLSIYIFMMIYGFQLIFILCYGFFISSNTWLKIVENVKMTRIIKRKNPMTTI